MVAAATDLALGGRLLGSGGMVRKDTEPSSMVASRGDSHPDSNVAADTFLGQKAGLENALVDDDDDDDLTCVV